MLQTLYGPVQDDLVLVEATFDRIRDTDFAPLKLMLDQVLAGGGKRMRPALALLSGAFARYDLDQLVPLAASIELLHTATLVHDDVIDNAPTRRGRATTNAIYNNAVSVMIGDYLFAHAADLVARTGNIAVVRLFSRTLMRIVSGELDQDISAFDASKRINDYLGRIGGKTASLFGTACEGGALASEAPEAWIEALRDYGFNLGMAFQIIDDILDFTGDEAVMGKPAGSDLMQGTLTLPSLLVMERSPDNNPVRRYFAARRNRSERLREAIDAVLASGAIEETRRIAEQYIARALDSLAPLPDTPARATLINLGDYVLQRDV